MTSGELKTLMEARGWDAKDVAELLQVTRSCVYNWVNEWRRIPRWHAKVLETEASRGKTMSLAAGGWQVH